MEKKNGKKVLVRSLTEGRSSTQPRITARIRRQLEPKKIMLNYTSMTNVDRALAIARKLNDEERDEFYERMLEVAPEMGVTERAALDAEIERSLDQVEAGRVVDADDVIAKLRARSA